MHSRWRRVVRRRDAEKVRNIGPRIRLVLTQVGVHLESRTGPSSRREMIEMPSMTHSRVVSVAVCMEVSACRF